MYTTAICATTSRCEEWSYDKSVSVSYKSELLLHYSAIEFLSRVSTQTRGIDIAILSVRLSARDVQVLDENGITYCHSFFTIR